MPDYTCIECKGFVGASLPSPGQIKYECMKCRKTKSHTLPALPSGEIDLRDES